MQIAQKLLNYGEFIGFLGENYRFLGNFAGKVEFLWFHWEKSALILKNLNKVKQKSDHFSS